MSSFKQTLSASGLLALSSGIAAVASILRYKIVAVQAGAEAVGVLGIVVALTTLALTVGCFGIPTSAVRVLAAAEGTETWAEHLTNLMRWRRRCTWLVGISMMFLLSLHRVIAGPTLDLVITLATVASAMLAVGVAFDGAILNAAQRFRDLALANSIGAVVGTALIAAGAPSASHEDLVALCLLGSAGAQYFANSIFRRRLVSKSVGRLMTRGAASYRASNRLFIGLGLAIVGGSSLALLGQFLVRLMISTGNGLQAAGLYQAAWSVAALYLSFVLTALSAEYFPRLTKLIPSPHELQGAIETQIRFSLALAAPCILFAMILADRILAVLYSDQFGAATLLLRLFLLGDVLKIASWAIVFAYAAYDWRWTTFLLELAFALTYVALAAACIPRFGIEGSGYAWITAYGLYFLLSLAVARRLQFDRFWRKVSALVSFPMFSAILTFTLLAYNTPATVTVAFLFALGVAIHSATTMRRLGRNSGPGR